MLFSIVWMMVIPAAASGPTKGGSYHPPAVTIITEGAPQDLEIICRLHKANDTVFPTQLQKKTCGWEQQFRLYREAVYGITRWYGNAYDLKDAELVLVSGEKETVIPLPQEITEKLTMNDVLTVHYRTGSITLGPSAWRGPLMLALRLLVVVVAVELLVFRLFRFREKRSLLIVAAVTFVAFGLVNIYTYGWLNSDPRRLILYIIFSLLILVVETLTCISFVEENDRDKTLSAALCGALSASVIHYLMLVFLLV
ncbi:MAG: hypothetical protein IK141_07735 [Clostridia bacterium]|nr:hypothetical protein [Clostridia bacterium]